VLPFISYLNFHAPDQHEAGLDVRISPRGNGPLSRASEERTMEHDISDILHISISLCFIIGGSIFAAMVVGMEYGVLEIPYGPYILLVIAVVIVILAGLIVITGMEREKET